ncbi:MAG TPA: BatA domain-containing protein [Thermodesulfobacteriota bacterium]|nr:BatA domain-containing protein [Thermodesulfobacteriota bacterium]
MNFSFLNPLFLIGLAAVALPVIAHLISRKSGVTKRFPAVRFLIASQGDASARSRLKDLLLLLLRAALIALLVLVFAKPALFTYAPAGASDPKSLAIVVDNSFSMGYGDNFRRAKEKAADLIDAIPDGSFGIVAPLVSPEGGKLSPSADKQSLRDELREIKISASFTNNEKRLEEALNALGGGAEGAKEVVFVTDMQKNGWAGDDAGKDWLRLIDVSEGPSPSNRAVTSIDTGHGKDSVTIRLSVSNFSDKPEDSLLATAALGRDEMSAYLKIPPEGTAGKEFAVPVGPAPADKSGDAAPDTASDGSVSIERDKLPIDDTRYFVLSQREGLDVLMVDGDPREDARLSETYYLARAAETLSEITNARITVKDNDSFLDEKLSGYGMVFLANVGDLTAASVKELSDFAASGGTVVIFLGERVRTSSYNALLKDLLPAELITEEDRETKLIPGPANPFPGDVVERLGQAGVKKYIKALPNPDAQVLLGLEDGDPFMMKRAFGKGNVFLITSTADTSWNNFSITPVFIPVVKSLLDIPGSMNEGRRNYIVGDKVPLDMPAGAGSAEVITPSGRKAGPDASASVFEGTYEPGIYTVKAADKDLYKFAVNVDPSESNLEKIKISAAPAEAEGKPGLVKIYRDIWRYFLWGAVILFISEAVTRSVFS